MAPRISPYALLLLTPLAVAALSGCSFLAKPERPAWRTQAENACLAAGRAQPTAYARIVEEIDGPGICGLTKPFKVTALQGGAVTFNATATLDCSMVAELDQWLADVVQPAAQARFGQNVARINSMGSFSCRGMNGQSGAPLSEHSFGNALDIGGFVLADGREISIVRDWTRGDEPTKDFLAEIHGGSCRHFTTVLSPGSNPFHYNHIHVDLAMHGRGGTRRICKPIPRDVAPPQGEPLIASHGPIDIDTDLPGPPPRAAFDIHASRGGGDGLAIAAPLPPPRPPARAFAPEPGARDPEITSSIPPRR
ncbi:MULTISPECIES: extensin-like domain-containing protein [Methylosinus]|uniref:Extensin n=1 Tax=Methylosinus trichosporium (strain ATCC 35070 / NCIMB 11131 / UNIQEM 75 / OB3b) TaxID=595536 RepID=A0A2D2CYV6_METT3|nr:MULTISPECIES: extensin family protein [Methylosinus]ATQ67931.1 extensin [Methylosinus trichosporium OB3b]OBS53787.1 extensin [Methylosinus sp. 3S-1]